MTDILIPPKNTIVVSPRNVELVGENFDEILKKLEIKEVSSYRMCVDNVCPDEYIYVIDNDGTLHTVMIRKQEDE